MRRHPELFGAGSAETQEAKKASTADERKPSLSTCSGEGRAVLHPESKAISFRQRSPMQWIEIGQPKASAMMSRFCGLDRLTFRRVSV